MLTSYHVHSANSDGTNSVIELVEAAIELGLDEIGVSDHLVYPFPGRPVGWSMSLEKLDSYFDDLTQAREAAGDRIKVRFGLECDYEPRTADALASTLKGYPLDYVIGSMHFLEEFPIDERAEHWERLKVFERDAMMMRYWIRMIDLARSGIFDFVGHIDVYKKFGHRPTVDLQRNIDEALDAIADAGMAVEINTSGLNVPAKETYPSKDILRRCRAWDIPILITADAHSTTALARHFDRARELAAEAGYEETEEWRVERGRGGAELANPTPNSRPLTPDPHWSL